MRHKIHRAPMAVASALLLGVFATSCSTEDPTDSTSGTDESSETSESPEASEEEGSGDEQEWFDQAVYDEQYEHDACGVAFVADLTGRRDHKIVSQALTALRNLEHRGARGAEHETGDGAGILIQVPDAFYREVVDFTLPEAGHYAVGTAFLPVDETRRGRAMSTIERIAA